MTHPAFALERLDFELAYLALLTHSGLKPLSRWEKGPEGEARRLLEQLGLRTRVVRRKVRSGRMIEELIFSRSAECLEMYSARFDGQPIEPNAGSARLEGLLFGFPSCCVGSYIAHGYRPNALRREEQRLLFHWACPRCTVTPALVPSYREVHARLCRARLKGSSRGCVPPQRGSAGKGLVARGLATAASLAALATPASLAAVQSPTPEDMAHWLSLYQWSDPDGDFLASTEEAFLGSNPDVADENGNHIPDGPELAKALAARIDALPVGAVTTSPYVLDSMAWGLEACSVCGTNINMGFFEVVNPLENQSIAIPYIGKHFLSHGSFEYKGGVHSGRVNVALLKFLLESRGEGHFLAEPAGTDLDKDGLQDLEEPPLLSDPGVRDTDADGLIDGIDLARQLYERLLALPQPMPDSPPKDQPYVVPHPMDGIETCPRCGDTVVMDYWDVIHPVSGATIRISSMALHHLSHGAFRWAGGRLMGGQGRVDPIHLQAVLTGAGDGHRLAGPGDSDSDGLRDVEETALFRDGFQPDEDSNGIADGVDLAQELAARIQALPAGPVFDKVHRRDQSMKGLEQCDICGSTVNMGFTVVCNPLAGLYAKVPFIGLHYLEHSCFSYRGDVHGQGRLDPKLLLSTLTSTGPSHLLAADKDADKDGLVDVEEGYFGFDRSQFSTANDEVPDGFNLARTCWEQLRLAPRTTNDSLYVVEHMMRGLVPCPVCATNINMGYMEVVNVRAESRLGITYLALHFMEHGSFSDGVGGRVNPMEVSAIMRPCVLVTASPDTASLRWFARAGNHYQVFRADSLAGPWGAGPTWDGEDREVEYADPQRPVGASRFYRVVVW